MDNNKSELLAQLRIDRSAAHSPRVLWPWWLAALLPAALVIGLAWKLTAAEAIPVQVEMARVTALQTRASSVLDGTGYVKARRFATVSSKVTGKVTEVLVEEGMSVDKDQIVARLDDSNMRKSLALFQAELVSAQTQVHETEARLQEARRTLERTQELANKKLVSAAALDSARANFNSLTAQLATRKAGITLAERRIAMEQQNLDDLVLRAPFAGVVISKDSQVGEMISPISAGGGFTRTGICTLVDMNSLEIEVDVNEAYIPRVRPDQPVTATLEAYPDWKIPARVIAIIPTADRQKATVKVRIAFMETDSRILPDMGVKVAFLGADVKDGGKVEGIRVPATAIRMEEGDAVLFVVRDDVALRRKVQVLRVNGGDPIIKSGLEPGEQYIVRLPAEVTDSVPVIISKS